MLRVAAPAWRLTEADETLAESLAARLKLRPTVARILVARGFLTVEAIGKFLGPRLGELRPPAGMADLDVVLTRIQAALSERQKVGVFGDYDVDGVTSAAVLTLGLRAFGAEVVPRVAARQSGYGLPPETVDAFADAGCRLIVTGDCGTSDVAALRRARERGLDVVVIDHHQVPSGDRLAFGMINPHQPEDRFPFKGLASCGIAFYLMAALRSRLSTTTFDPRELLDLVAIGTIGDLVPLVDENRILVAAGLKVLSARRRPGIRALASLAHLEDAPLTAEDVSFRMAPRLNAAGRLGDAQLALDLLLAPNDAEASRLAAQIDDVNRERQRIQEQVWLEATVEAERWADAPAIVVGGQGWHHGVVGIIAARLVDRFGKPAIVVGFDGDSGRGSARTTGGLNLYESLASTSAHLLRFGGHAGAAGLSVAVERFAPFRDDFLAEVGRRTASRSAPVLEVDALVELEDVNVSFAEELQRLGPYGAGNREPLLALRGLVTEETRVLGKGHLHLAVTTDGGRGEAIAFNMAEHDPGRGATIDLLACLEVDTFRGARRSRLRVRHLWRQRAEEAPAAEPLTGSLPNGIAADLSFE